MTRDVQVTQNARSGDSRPPPWIWLVGVGGFIATVVWYLVLRTAHGGSHMLMSEHGDLGSSFGPLSALFALSAVMAALWSMELQRRELRGQTVRLDEHQRLLEEQRAQFTRSADAHERLALAQTDAVVAQKRANLLTERLIESQQESLRLSKEAAKRSLEIELAQHWATALGVQAAASQIVVAKETARQGLPVLNDSREVLEREAGALGVQMHRECTVIAELERRIREFK